MSNEKYRVELVDTSYYKKIISCQSACPAHTDADGYVNAIARGEDNKAFHIARQPNPFVYTCGRICKAPCEVACRRGKIDAPVSIRALKRFATERGGGLKEYEGPAGENSQTAESLAVVTKGCGTRDARPAKGAKVAIVGAGPAGLTAAHDLLRTGYRVTLFEFLPSPGGTVRTAIPTFRLPWKVIDQEIRDIVALGAELRTDTLIEDAQLSARLKDEGYEAIFIATGADLSRKLSRPDEGVFAEGDMLFDVVAVIDAVGAGHLAARLIDQYLRWVKARVITRAWMTPVKPAAYPSEDCLQIERRDPPLRTMAMDEGVSELEECYSEDRAREQASRCLKCHIQTVFNGDLCILCGGCVDVCPQSCYKMVRLDQLEGDERLGGLVEARYGIPLEAFQKGGEVLSQGTAMLKNEARCVRCGLCAKRCPTGAITMEAFWFEEELAYEAEKVPQEAGTSR